VKAVVAHISFAKSFNCLNSFSVALVIHLTFDICFSKLKNSFIANHQIKTERVQIVLAKSQKACLLSCANFLNQVALFTTFLLIEVIDLFTSSNFFLLSAVHLTIVSRISFVSVAIFLFFIDNITYQNKICHSFGFI
jgi:hypothetical protein